MRRELVIGLGLFVAAFAVRLIFAAQLVFPPLDDPAFYVQTARHLAAGRGLVSDVIWNYFVPFTSVTHPSHEYWMPLATWLMSPFLKVLGDTLLGAQVPGIISGALLTPLTYVLGRIVWPTERDRKWAVLAAVMLIGGAVPVYQAASTDSAAPFALCASAALLAGGLAVEWRSLRWSCAAGVLSGLAYLARSDGLLIPAIIGLLLGRAALRQRVDWLNLLSFGAITGLISGGWWWRNLAIFGATQPVSPWTLLALQNYGQLFNFHSAPTLEQLLARGWPFILDLRAQALSHNWGVWIVIAFPFGLLGLPGLWLDRRPVLHLGLIYGLALAVITGVVFSVPTLMGLFYHSAAATLPWLAVGSMIIIRRLARRWRRAFFFLTALLIGLLAMQAVLAWPIIIADGRVNQAKFGSVTAWLRLTVPPDQPVITNEAHSLNYASGYATVTLPNQQDVVTLRALADQYGARYVVVFGSIGLYPAALDQATASAQLIGELPDIRLYDLRPSQ